MSVLYYLLNKRRKAKKPWPLSFKAVDIISLMRKFLKMKVDKNNQKPCSNQTKRKEK